MGIKRGNILWPSVFQAETMIIIINVNKLGNQKPSQSAEVNNLIEDIRPGTDIFKVNLIGFNIFFSGGAE